MGDFSSSSVGSGYVQPMYDSGSTRTGGSYIQMSAPDGSSNARINFNFNGRCLGVSLSTVSALGSKNMSCLIDGVAYPFPPVPRAVTDPGNSLGGGVHFYPIADDLRDGPHQVSLFLIGDPSATAQVMLLFGIYVEERVGYRPPPPSAALSNSALVTVTTRQLLSTVFGGSSAQQISAIHLANVTGTDCLVTLDKAGATFWREIVAGNKTREINFPLPVGIYYSNYGLTVQTASAIQITLWGLTL
jgi:hypothetical protein